jgi:hypothetical protein
VSSTLAWAAADNSEPASKLAISKFFMSMFDSGLSENCLLVGGPEPWTRTYHPHKRDEEVRRPASAHFETLRKVPEGNFHPSYRIGGLERTPPEGRAGQG